MKNRAELERLKADAEPAKMRLISILDELQGKGYDKEAQQLERIIIKLEVWQNK